MYVCVCRCDVEIEDGRSAVNIFIYILGDSRRGKRDAEHEGGAGRNDGSRFC